MGVLNPDELVAAGGPSVSIPNVAGRTSLSLLKFRAGIASVLSGLSNFRILFCGNSTVSGTGSGAGGINVRSLSTPSRVKQLLIARGIPAEDDSWIGTADGMSSDSNYNPKISVPVGWVKGGTTTQTMGGPMWSAPFDNTNTFGFTPEYPTNTYEVWYPNNAAYGPFTISNGTQSKVITPTGGTNAILKATLGPADGVPSTAAAYTWTITRNGTGGTDYFLAGHAYDTNTKRVEIFNAGWPGSLSTQWATSTNPWSPLNMFSVFAPGWSDIDLGINDYSLTAGNPNTTQAAYQAAMTSIVAAAAAVGGVSVEIPVPSDTSKQANDVQAQYGAIAKSVGLAAGAIVRDMRERWGGSYAVSNAAGLMSDVVHPNTKGYYDKARATVEMWFG